MRRLALIICLLAASTAFAQDEAPTLIEVARIERRAGPGNTSAHLSPDGQRILHIDQDTFCVLTITGEEQGCASGTEATGLPRIEIEPDHDSVTWSPDGRYVAYTTMGLVRALDTDIWLLDVERGQFQNLTDDGYYGRLFSDDAQDVMLLDLAPAWMPDGTLTFVRQVGNYGDTPMLYTASLDGGLAQPVTALLPDVEAVSTVMSLDWSADGQTLAYVVYATGDDGEQVDGIWLYTAGGEPHKLQLGEDVSHIMRADLSPDATQLLAVSVERGLHGTDVERDGYLIVSTETDEVTRIDPQQRAINAGWLPDSSLLYIGRTPSDPEADGIFVTTDPAGTGQKLSDLPEYNGEPLPISSPTARTLKPLRVNADGRLVVGSLEEMMIVYQIETSVAPAANTHDAPAAAQDFPVTAAREITRLPLMSGPVRTSSHLSPDGEWVMHVQGGTFCLYTQTGEQQWCTDVVETIEDRGRTLNDIDPESIVWSPDSRYLAFTTLVLQYFRDSDIWVFDITTREYTNLTDDGYSGAIVLGDDIPEDMWIDLAPAWRPDGYLSFARHGHNFRSTLPSLMVIDPAGGTPEELAKVESVQDTNTIIMSLDWSDDGSKMAFVIDSTSNPFGGLWLYDAVESDVRPLVIIQDAQRGYYVADFSPDGEHILILSVEREIKRTAQRDESGSSGYYVVKASGGVPQPLTSDLFISGAGWTLDNRIVYTAADREDQADGGLFVTSVAGEPVTKVLDFPTSEGDIFRLFPPTSRQIAPIRVNDAGLLLLGTAKEMTLLLDVTTGEDAP